MKFYQFFQGVHLHHIQTKVPAARTSDPDVYESEGKIETL